MRFENWPELTDEVAATLSTLKETEQHVLEKAIATPAQNVFTRAGIILAREGLHPAFQNASSRQDRWIDFVFRETGPDKYALAIEAKLLPETSATPAKYGHDLVKDVIRLALLDPPSQG